MHAAIAAPHLQGLLQPLQLLLRVSSPMCFLPLPTSRYRNSNYQSKDIAHVQKHIAERMAFKVGGCDAGTNAQQQSAGGPAALERQAHEVDMQLASLRCSSRHPARLHRLHTAAQLAAGTQRAGPAVPPVCSAGAGRAAPRRRQRRRHSVSTLLHMPRASGPHKGCMARHLSCAGAVSRRVACRVGRQIAMQPVLRPNKPPIYALFAAWAF